jgi:hypothetical protein
MARKSIVTASSVAVADTKKIVPLFAHASANVRPDAQDNQYLEEAMRVLPVGSYRSAIGSVWNAVVDDLRNKIIHRSVMSIICEGYGSDRTYFTQSSSMERTFTIEGSLLLGWPSNTWRVSFACLSILLASQPMTPVLYAPSIRTSSFT